MSKKIKIEAKIDLHGFYQDQAFDALHKFFTSCQEKQKRLVLVITGKGRNDKPSVLKTNFPRWLKYTDLSSYITTFDYAPDYLGGEGAFVVRLKKLAN